MTMEKYVKSIIRKLKCSGKKRKEIKQQLLSDISISLENGESMEQIMGRMGSAASVAAEFNENMPPIERKLHKRNLSFKLGGLILALAALLCFGVLWVLPKGETIGKDGVFKESLVKAQMKNIITWVNEENYDELKEHSISLLQPTWSGDDFSQAKAALSSDWGDFQRYGHFYLSQLEQSGKKYAVGQVTVTYENVSVTYTLTFDEDLTLAGIYIK